MKLRICLICLVSFGLLLVAQDTHFAPQGDQIPGPEGATTADHSAWLADLKQWRRERLIRSGFEDSQYKRPEFLWTQKNFVSPQVMVEERYLYDPVERKYTVDRYLDDLENAMAESTAS
jgi:hypothetical protein